MDILDDMGGTPEINIYFTNGLCKMFGDHSKQPVKNACDHITCAV